MIYILFFFWLANSNYGKKDSTNDKYSSVKFVWEMSGKLLLLYICVLAYIFLFQACDKKNKFYNIFSPLFTVIMISNFKKNYFPTWFFLVTRFKLTKPILTIIFITRYFRIFNFLNVCIKFIFSCLEAMTHPRRHHLWAWNSWGEIFMTRFALVLPVRLKKSIALSYKVKSH